VSPRLWYRSADVLIFDSLGGMCGAIVTSPFDVVKTRLQSSLFREVHPIPSAAASHSHSLAGAGVGIGGGGSVPLRTAVSARPGGLLWNFVETGHIIRYARVLLTSTTDIRYPARDIYTNESPKALFRGECVYGYNPSMTHVLPLSVYRPRPNPRRRHPSTVHQLLHIR
jgi:hypothetical protein